MRYLSHDVIVPDETVKLGPFAIWREPGHHCDSPKSAVRALQIIELMAKADVPLRAIEVVRALDISPSSANQLLKVMMDWGYVIFDRQSKRYYPSPRLAKMGVQASFTFFGPGTLGRLMTAVQQETGLSITILCCQGTFMQIVDHLLLPIHYPRFDDLPETTKLGLQVPLLGSCTGAAWLSSQDNATIRSAIHLCKRELTWQVGDEETILERIKEIKRQGYSFGGMSVANETRSLSIPLPRTANGLVLVLCMSGTKDEMDPGKDEIAHIARQLAEEHLSAI